MAGVVSSTCTLSRVHGHRESYRYGLFNVCVSADIDMGVRSVSIRRLILVMDVMMMMMLLVSFFNLLRKETLEELKGSLPV